MNDRKQRKIEMFLNWATDIALLSVSSRLKVGCVSVKRDFSTTYIGYNGSYPNAKIRVDTGTEEFLLLPGKSGFVHAEINMALKFHAIDPEQYNVLITHSPCIVCATALINRGFKRIFWKEDYRETSYIREIFETTNCIVGTWNDLIEKDLW